ncbi:MAG: DNA recombination protein RmuC [Oscillospiraceae bacterium]|nr:DNA recombination protein RmuC [Oscillospiraceae bacterium]
MLLLQIGFKTCAIKQRSQAVWNTLRLGKKRFGDFETMLSQVHKQLQTADNATDKRTKTRRMALCDLLMCCGR